MRLGYWRSVWFERESAQESWWLTYLHPVHAIWAINVRDRWRAAGIAA